MLRVFTILLFITTFAFAQDAKEIEINRDKNQEIVYSFGKYKCKTLKEAQIFFAKYANPNGKKLVNVTVKINAKLKKEDVQYFCDRMTIIKCYPSKVFLGKNLFQYKINKQNFSIKREIQ